MRGKEGGRSRSKSPKRPKTSTGIRQTVSALDVGEGDGRATSKWISPYNARQLRSLDRRSTSEIIRSLKSSPHVGTYGRLHMGESLIEPDERQIFEPFRVTVLVVSGSVDTQRRLHEVLNAGGYCTRVANGIASALAVLRDNGCNAIICDQTLPDGNALNLLQQIMAGAVKEAKLILVDSIGAGSTLPSDEFPAPSTQQLQKAHEALVHVPKVVVLQDPLIQHPPFRRSKFLHISSGACAFIEHPAHAFEVHGAVHKAMSEVVVRNSSPMTQFLDGDGGSSILTMEKPNQLNSMSTSMSMPKAKLKPKRKPGTLRQGGSTFESFGPLQGPRAHLRRQRKAGRRKDQSRKDARERLILPVERHMTTEKSLLNLLSVTE